MIQRLLIANRGEIACRVIKTAKRFYQTKRETNIKINYNLFLIIPFPYFIFKD